jgi:ribosomal 50S subunit-associated protein YjgA (DUF615 family)
MGLRNQSYMTSREFINKIIRMRSRLIKDGKGHRNSAAIISAIKKLKIWLEAYPKASEHQVRNFLRSHSEEVFFILPGKGSRAHDSLMQQLNSILYGHQESN